LRYKRHHKSNWSNGQFECKGMGGRARSRASLGTWLSSIRSQPIFLAAKSDTLLRDEEFDFPLEQSVFRTVQTARLFTQLDSRPSH
jgi:hypothetical protein